MMALFAGGWYFSRLLFFSFLFPRAVWPGSTCGQPNSSLHWRILTAGRGSQLFERTSLPSCIFFSRSRAALWQKDTQKSSFSGLHLPVCLFPLFFSFILVTCIYSEHRHLITSIVSFLLLSVNRSFIFHLWSVIFGLWSWLIVAVSWRIIETLKDTP